MSNIHPKVVEAGRLLQAGNIEDAMDKLAEFFEDDISKVAADFPSRDAVIGLLESCRDSAQAISFKWYASLR